jgi:hypothetical protein
MEVENATTDPISRSHESENIHSNSETIRSSLPLVATENEMDDGTDSEDENYKEGIINMLDFVSELQ